MPFVNRRSAGDEEGGVLSCLNSKLGPAESCFGRPAGTRGLLGTLGCIKEEKERVSSSLSMVFVRARREFVVYGLYQEECVVGLANGR